mgnify:CR=1 FL=1
MYLFEQIYKLHISLYISAQILSHKSSHHLIKIIVPDVDSNNQKLAIGSIQIQIIDKQ